MNNAYIEIRVVEYTGKSYTVDVIGIKTKEDKFKIFEHYTDALKYCMKLQNELSLDVIKFEEWQSDKEEGEVISKKEYFKDENKNILKDEVLFTHRLNLEGRTKGKDSLSLCKQSYSDGTCFYMLKDGNGFYKLEYGNSNLISLIQQLEHEIKIYEKYAGMEVNLKYPEIQNVYKGVIGQLTGMIDDMKTLNETEYGQVGN